MFLPKCIISTKFFLSYYKSNFEIFTGPEIFTCLVFYFSIVHFDDFLTTFAKDFMKKPTIFITNIKSTHNLLHFHKDLRSRNFWQWDDGLFLKNEKTTFFGGWFWQMWKGKKFELSKFVKYGQRYFYSERLWHSKLSLLKLRAVELAILALKSLWKSMKLWELLISVMKTGGFFIDPW